MDVNSFVNIVGILAMVITWFIVSPLKESISTLQELVKELKISLEERRKDLSLLGERVARGEETIHSTTKRLVQLEKEFHSLCSTCKCHKGE